MTVFCGIDWAERHHDVALVDEAGTLLAKARITDDAAGYHKLLALLAEHGDSPDDPIPVAIETSHGLLVASLRTGNRRVFAINPLAAARYRDRHGVSRKKSDPGDALVLANILRTDMHAHRPLPADSELAQAITVLARAQQDAVWTRQQVANQVRSLLREYYPAALLAFQGKQGGLTRADARVILTLAPTPAKAAKLTLAQLRAALKRSGRLRGCDAEAERLRDVFRAEYAHQLPGVENAFGHQLLALLKQLDATREAADDLAEAATAAFHQHADSEILLSFPGLGPMLGARVLAELGDRPGTVRRRQGAEVVRRIRPHHAGLRQEAVRRPPLRQEQPPHQRRLSLGLRRLTASPPHRLTGSERALPTPTRAWRLACSRTTALAEPLPRPAPPLSQDPAAFRRTAGLCTAPSRACFPRQPDRLRR